MAGGPARFRRLDNSDVMLPDGSYEQLVPLEHYQSATQHSALTDQNAPTVNAHDMEHQDRGPQLRPHLKIPSDASGPGDRFHQRPLTSRSCGHSIPWFKESLALVISWGCQVALIVILLKMSDQPLEKWTGLISLNAMISILTTISKSMMLLPVAACISQMKWLYLKRPRRIYDFELFDKASRGPDGSLELMLSRPIQMASVGCLVTIIASAIGPFTQQVIDFNTKAVSFPNVSASFGYAYAYNTEGDNRYGGGGIDPRMIDFSLRGAVLKGLYNFDSTPKFTCPGTCAWNDTWITLGFSHDCKDVSEDTFSTRRCYSQSNEEVSPWVKESQSFDCNMTTPGNVTLKHEFVATDTQTTQYVSSVNHLGSGLSLKSQDPMFMTIAQYRASDWLNTTHGNLVENVTECNISLTAWEMSGTSSKGQEFSIANRTRIPLITQPVLTDQTSGSHTGVLTWNQTGLPEPFNMSTWDWLSLAAAMDNLFFNVSEVVGVSGLTDWNSVSPLFSETTTGGDINIWIDRITRALTDAVRSGPNKQLSYGYAEDQIIFVQVYWVWYIIPFVTEVAALLLLVHSIWRSRLDSGIPLWRSSVLAPLFHKVEVMDDISTNFVARTDIKDMQELKGLAKSYKMTIP